MKRNLFDELQEGFNALQSEREGKITLRQHVVEKKPVPTITPDELMTLRDKLHLSRTVFARYLRTNERTLENWEQGRSSPNAQATILIRLVERYPDTVERLATI
jgi:putative transcriptional regulator